TLRTLLHLELHRRAFVEAAITAGLNRGKVDKYVIAAGSLNETISLRGIEPLHCTFFLHCKSPEMFVVLLGLPDKERRGFRGLLRTFEARPNNGISTA